MTNEEFNKELGQIRARKQKQLNEIYWWVSVSLTSLDNSLKDKSFTDKMQITVPSGKSTKEITRTKEQIHEILKQARDIDIYQSVFVFIVAQVEDFFSNLIYLILSTDNRRIKASVSGIDLTKKFDVVEILDSADKSEIVDKIIRKNLASIFYAGPSKQKEYFDKILGIKFEDSYWDDWFEFKATRDIVVHNSGTINELYIEKSGSKARGKYGEKIKIDSKYFGDSIATMKSIIGKCEVGARKSLGPKKK